MTEAITDADVGYALDLVKRICAEAGPGLSGSSQERDRAAILKHELESHLGTGNAVFEEFTVAPGAFLAAPPIAASFTLAAAILSVTSGQLTGGPMWVTSIVAVACATAAVLLISLEFLFYVEVIDRWSRTRQSENVVGTLRRPGPREVGRLLIVSGHHDSAQENTWFRFLGYGGLVASGTMFIGFAAMFAAGVLQLVGLVAGNAGLVRLGTPGWILLTYPIVPSIVVGLFFTRGKKHGGNVPGAVDNLAACALVVSLCRFLTKNPDCIPADTEIRFITFGSEEAGVRGSRRYVERHRAELERLDARLLNFEMVADPTITILTSDLNRSVKSDPEMVNSVVAAAESAGVPYRVKPAGIGVGTDAGPFSRAGLKAVTLFPFKVPQQLVAFYHQKWDRPEVLTMAPLSNVLKLALAWIRSSGVSTGRSEGEAR